MIVKVLNALLYFVSHHREIFYFYDCESAKLKNWSTQVFWWCIGRNMALTIWGLLKKNESMIKKEIFLELEIQRVIR